MEENVLVFIDTAIQGFDCGRVAAREFKRMSVHPNFVRFLHTKS